MNLGHSANKRRLLEELLDLGMVLVALDARVDGVDVPAHLSADPQLRLNLSYRFGLPMQLDAWGIGATLTFAGVPHDCRFPWAAVFLMVSHINGEPYLFPTDVPQELVHHGRGEGQWSLRDSVLPTSAPPARPQLTVISQVATPERPVEAARPRKRSRRASGSGFSSASRRTAREPAEDDLPHEPSSECPPEQMPPPDGERPPRSRRHLRVVK